MYEVGNLVTLKSDIQFDHATHISEDEVGEIVEYERITGRFLIEFDRLRDTKGDIPKFWSTAPFVTLYQI